MKHERTFMNLTHGRILSLALVAIGVLGCDSLTNVSTKLDGTADATFWFWARLQGIQYRENDQIASLNKSNLRQAKAYDVDGTSKGFSSLAAKHSHIAQQLNSLDSEKVDQIALEYRYRLVAAHEALKNEWKKQAAAAMERDMQTLEKRETLETELIEYVNIWNERYSVMTDLKSKYNRNFDVVD
jgi:hypothetical protein